MTPVTVPLPGPLHAPRSPSWARHPLCAGDREGLLCGWDVAPQRDRGRPSGARGSQLFSGCVISYNKNAFKDANDDDVSVLYDKDTKDLRFSLANINLALLTVLLSIKY